jgi:hypothetical protein
MVFGEREFYCSTDNNALLGPSATKLVKRDRIPSASIFPPCKHSREIFLLLISEADLRQHKLSIASRNAKFFKQVENSNILSLNGLF